MEDSPSVTPDPPRTGGGVSNGRENRTRRQPASNASIEAMPRIKVEEGDASDGCSICLEELKVDEEASEMPCKHVFHSGCVETWLRINRACPVCRYLMPAEEGESGGGSGLGSEDPDIHSEIAQLLLTVSRLADSISTMVSGRGPNSLVPGQVDDGDEPLAQDMH